MNERRGSVSVVLVTDEIFKQRVIDASPGSFLTIIPRVNEFFGGSLKDDSSIDTILRRVDPNSGAKNVELTGIWDKVEATERQLREIEKRFNYLIFSSFPTDTIGDLRSLAERKIIKKIKGVDRAFQVFCAESFRRIEDSSGK